MLLWSSASEQGFSDSRWMTYKQAQAEGGQVRKGERGTTAIFYSTLEKENDDGETDHIPMLKTFTDAGFRVAQVLAARPPRPLGATPRSAAWSPTLARCSSR